MKEKIIKVKDNDYRLTFEVQESWYELKLFNQEDKECGFLNFSVKNKESMIWIYKIEVLEEERFKGLGQKLLDAVEAFGFMRRIDSIEGNFYPTNEYARTFYEKNGYEIYKDGYSTQIFKSIYSSKLRKENQEKVEVIRDICI